MISHYIKGVYLINQMFNKMMDQIQKYNKSILKSTEHKYNHNKLKKTKIHL